MPYKQASLTSPHLQAGGEGQRPRIHADSLLFGATQLHVPSIAFGTKDPGSLDLGPSDHGSWYEQTLNIPEVYRFRIENAVVHPPFGIVTVDNWVLQETLAHIPFHLPGYGRSDDEVTFPVEEISGSFNEALHVMGGNHINYYHWLLDIMPKFQVEPLAPFTFEGGILAPPPGYPAQQDMLALLLLKDRSVTLLAGRRPIKVESLLFVPNLVGFGFAPNPALAGFFDQLRRLLKVDEPPKHRIYVMRKDSQNRVLTNENEVVALVERYGFEPVHLSDLSLAAQARLFASASHIVAPHGAGLANLVFCNPGISICELHMAGYLNWCFRRLGGIRDVNYGCIIGAPEPSEHKWAHARRWSVPLAQLEAVLNDRQFLRPGGLDTVSTVQLSEWLQGHER